MFIELNEDQGGINTDRIEWMGYVVMRPALEGGDPIFYFDYALIGKDSSTRVFFKTKEEAEAKRKEISNAMNGKISEEIRKMCEDLHKETIELQKMLGEEE